MFRIQLVNLYRSRPSQASADYVLCWQKLVNLYLAGELMAKHNEDKMATGLPMSLEYEGNFSSNTETSQPEWLMFVTRYLSYHVPVTAVGQSAYLQQGKGEDKAGHNVASVCYVDDGCC